MFLAFRVAFGVVIGHQTRPRKHPLSHSMRLVLYEFVGSDLYREHSTTNLDIPIQNRCLHVYQNIYICAMASCIGVCIFCTNKSSPFSLNVITIVTRYVGSFAVSYRCGWKSLYLVLNKVG